MSWQNITLGLCSLGFVIALVPAVLRHRPPHWATCAMTAVLLMAIAVVYASLHFWFAWVTTTLTAGLWITLFFQATGWLYKATSR